MGSGTYFYEYPLKQIIVLKEESSAQFNSEREGDEAEEHSAGLVVTQHLVV